MKQKSFKLFRGKYCEFKKRLYICRPNREKGTLKRSSLHIGLRNKECKKPCQLSLKLIARTQTTHYNGEFDPGSG